MAVPVSKLQARNAMNQARQDAHSQTELSAVIATALQQSLCSFCNVQQLKLALSSVVVASLDLLSCCVLQMSAPERTWTEDEQAFMRRALDQVIVLTKVAPFFQNTSQQLSGAVNN
jgi:hypothetical protein